MPMSGTLLPADPMAVDGAAAAVAQPAAPGAADAAVPAAHDPMLGSSLDARLRRAALAAGEGGSQTCLDHLATDWVVVELIVILHSRTSEASSKMCLSYLSVVVARVGTAA